MTRSPSLKFETPSPTATTRPEVSWPKIRGAECEPVAIFFRSVPQMPQVCTRTRSSPGPIFGTGTGLVTKYILDKKWIFFDPSIGVAAHGRSFTLYAVTGVLTTAIFWGLEYAFDGLTTDGRWRYLGGAIGLAIGYAVKFHLDRRFVFSKAERA